MARLLPGVPAPVLSLREEIENQNVSHSVFATLWTVAHQTPLSMEFSRQEYQSGLPFPPPGDLPDPGFEPGRVSCIAGRFFTI